ncbi:hypothetical protein SmJEL517_g00831 [Synchytrium microbalum]|uniref:Peptidase A1 domain-containing protein n=1 Tax=Synchytrium microbalum TaxID=1806994 RepID=A0A507CHX0_9FUNG|nr:uncharacterized protein SmJEL517_g00831 [Synchytrium microbalum]TPX37213.1 hypothetical protein SmJEL517_g00831 [Synchytrium microbalum]
MLPRSTSLCIALLAWCSIVRAFPQDPCPIRPNSYDANVNYFANNQATVSYAKYFTITYTNTYKIVNITATSPPTVFVLYLCNNPQPNVTGIPATNYVSIPVRSAAFADMPSIRYIERFGQGGSVTSATNLDDIISPCMQTAVTNGSIQALPSSGVPPVSADILFAGTLFAGSSALPPQVPTLYQSEITPMARFEWIKLFAAFYNLDDWTGRLFSRVAGEYTCIVSGVSGFVGQTNLPIVAWLKLENGRYVSPDEAYSQQLIKDAAGIPIAMPDSGYFVDQTNMLVGVLAADYLLDNTAVGGTNDDSSVPIQDGVYTFESFQTNYGMTYQAGISVPYKFYNNRAVYRADRTRTPKAYDAWPLWYPAQPISSLLDVVEMIHGPYTNLTFPTYFRNISSNTQAYEFLNPTCDVPLYKIPDLPTTSCAIALADGDTVQPPQFGWVPDAQSIFVPLPGAETPAAPNNGSKYAELIAAVVVGLFIFLLVLFGLAWWCYRRGRNTGEKHNFQVKMPRAVRRHLKGKRPDRDGDGSRNKSFFGPSSRGNFPVLTGGAGRWNKMPEDKTTIFDASPWDDSVSTAAPGMPVRVIVEGDPIVDPFENTTTSRSRSYTGRNNNSSNSNGGKKVTSNGTLSYKSTTFKQPSNADIERNFAPSSEEDDEPEEIEMRSPPVNPWTDRPNDSGAEVGTDNESRRGGKKRNGNSGNNIGSSVKTFGKGIMDNMRNQHQQSLLTKFGKERGEGSGFLIKGEQLP